MCTHAKATIREGKDWRQNTGRCGTSWMCCWLVGVSRSNVSRAIYTVWVECAPRRRVARSATVVLGVLANGLYRRRTRDWDPGFRMRARFQESSTQAPRTRRLSLPDAPTRLVSLRPPFTHRPPAGARLLLLTCRVADTGVTYPWLYLPLPAWLPAYLPRIWPCLFFPACPVCLRKDVRVINNYHDDVVSTTRAIAPASWRRLNDVEMRPRGASVINALGSIASISSISLEAI